MPASRQPTLSRNAPSPKKTAIATAIAQSGEPAASTPGTPTVRWRHDPEHYAHLIAECQAAIARGDAYQLCLTNRVDVDVRPDPAEAYLALRASSPTITPAVTVASPRSNTPYSGRPTCPSLRRTVNQAPTTQ